MKRAAWFIISELLLVLAIVLVFANWHGSANFALAWPLSGCTLSLQGEAQGGQVLLAFITALLTVAAFVLGLIRLFRRDGQLPPPQRPLTPATASPGAVPPASSLPKR